VLNCLRERVPQLSREGRKLTAERGARQGISGNGVSVRRPVRMANFVGKCVGMTRHVTLPARNLSSIESCTTGQLQLLHAGLDLRAHIIANWPPVYIGKESDKHWEEGDDWALLDFKAIQYKRKGIAVADREQLARIAKVSKREFMRRGINQHTLAKICARGPVRTLKLAKCLRVLEEYELERNPNRSKPLQTESNC
jgi:hypothetical protein